MLNGTTQKEKSEAKAAMDALNKLSNMLNAIEVLKDQI